MAHDGAGDFGRAVELVAGAEGELVDEDEAADVGMVDGAGAALQGVVVGIAWGGDEIVQLFAEGVGQGEGEALGEAAGDFSRYGAPVLIWIEEIDETEKQLLTSLISPVPIQWETTGSSASIELKNKILSTLQP